MSQILRSVLRSVTVATLIAATAPAQAQTAPPVDTRPHVMAFFSAEGELDHYLFAIQAMRWFAANAPLAGYRFTATSDANLLATISPREVQLVVWLNDQPQQPAQRDGFRRYMEHGGAWIGFHSVAFIAADRPWPWYRDEFLGAPFRGNNWPSLPARVNVDTPDHPVMKGVPPSFVTPINEWYSWKTPAPRANRDIKILLTLDPSNFPLGVKNTINGGDNPVAWTNTRFKMVYLNYGHGDRVLTSAALGTMMDNAVKWLLGLKP